MRLKLEEKTLLQKTTRFSTVTPSLEENSALASVKKCSNAKKQLLRSLRNSEKLVQLKTFRVLVEKKLQQLIIRLIRYAT